MGLVALSVSAEHGEAGRVQRLVSLKFYVGQPMFRSAKTPMSAGVHARHGLLAVVRDATSITLPDHPDAEHLPPRSPTGHADAA